jgi:catechol 2,3-dioxygenase-like lactoylglutathione lyase family enzyme
MINIRAIDHVVFRVADVEKVGAFYTDVLGATWERRREDIGLHQLRLGSCMVDLVPVDSKLGQMCGAAPGQDGHNVDHVAFQVDPWDGEAILDHLRRHGLNGEIATRYGAEGDGPSIYIQDPEGNGVELKGSAKVSVQGS